MNLKTIRKVSILGNFLNPLNLKPLKPLKPRRPRRPRRPLRGVCPELEFPRE
jgi:hypothetical protein